MTQRYGTHQEAHIHPLVAATCPGWNDPLLPDEDGDLHMSVSMRGLVRLALVASEAGARFQREAVGEDPMAWMLAPRRLFGGGTAIEACLRLEPCRRAILMHGLGMGFDADPEDFDDILCDDETMEEADGRLPSAEIVSPEFGKPRLFTAVAVDETEDGMMQAFEAVVARSSHAARESMRSRHGDRVADSAEICEGFDPGAPLVVALVSSAVADMLTHVANDPSSLIARGLEVAISQRFAE